jgi:adenylate kinase
MAKVVYLTGAPAAGKSTTTKLLAKSIANLEIWEYGARLTEYLHAKNAAVENQDYLRSASASVVTARDVECVDEALLSFVTERRGSAPILIDSHAVTKEHFGYRITPFSFAKFQLLAPDEIWVLYATPAETRRRIAADPGGRPAVSLEEAAMHTALQSSVAATYGMAIGKPVYLFDTAVPGTELMSRLVERLS